MCFILQIDEIVVHMIRNRPELVSDCPVLVSPSSMQRHRYLRTAFPLTMIPDQGLRQPLPHADNFQTPSADCWSGVHAHRATQTSVNAKLNCDAVGTAGGTKLC
jgi:hypothetical protein